MSILLKEEIKREYENGRIVINPYSEKQLGPNSYDVTLSDQLVIYDITTEPLDSRKENKTITIDIPKEGFVLKPGILYLGSTVEKIGSDHYIPMYEGRSSMARMGLQTHISAGFGDVGFKSQWTLEIIVVHPVKIYPFMSIGQIYFNHINPEFNYPENRYSGKYVDQVGPTASKSFLDKL